MKRVIRRGVFETNSSSVHSLTICTDEEYNKWKNRELVWDYYTEKLVPVNDDSEKDAITIDDDYRYYSYDGMLGHGWFRDAYELYEEEYTTPNGETIHAFGYYGYD